MSDVYSSFLAGDLSLQVAAELLQAGAPEWRTQAGSLRLDTLPDADREKAAELFDKAIEPILAPYLAGDISSESAALQLAPLVFPVGVFALNFTMPSGPDADRTMSRMSELIEKLAGLDGSTPE